MFRLENGCISRLLKVLQVLLIYLNRGTLTSMEDAAMGVSVFDVEGESRSREGFPIVPYSILYIHSPHRQQCP